MGVVEKLNATCPERVSYYCSKADSITDANDRQKVLIQITQNLSGRIKNPHTFDIPTIYLPNEEIDEAEIPNNIFAVCEKIDATISAAVQTGLNNIKIHCEQVQSKLKELSKVDEEHVASNSTRMILNWVSFVVCFFFSLLIPLSLLLSKLERAFGVITSLKIAVSGGYAEPVVGCIEGLASIAPLYFTSLEEEVKGIGMALVVLTRYWLANTVVFSYLMPVKPTMTKAEHADHKAYAERCEELLKKRRAWYKEYQEIAIHKDT